MELLRDGWWDGDGPGYDVARGGGWGFWFFVAVLRDAVGDGRGDETCGGSLGVGYRHSGRS